MSIIDKNTDHAERFSRPMLWVRRGWEKRKPTALRRLELRRVRRVRGIEVRQVAIPEGLSMRWPLGIIDCARCEIESDPFEEFYEDRWDVDETDEHGIDRADSERSGFRVTIGEVAR